MNGLLVIFLAGFAGSFHCIGMCGGFACGLARFANPGLRALLMHSLLYNMGRLATYAFIGVLAGSFGMMIMGTPGHMGHGAGHNMPAGEGIGFLLAGELGVAQRLLSIAAGGLMLLMAFELFGLRRHVRKSWAALGATKFAGVLRGLALSRHPAAPLVLGVANGFLPCPLVFAFTAVAAATGSILSAVSIMLAFGFGTFPAMILMSLAGLVLSPLVRVWGVRFAGTFVLIIGLLTLIRGLTPETLHVAGRAIHIM